MLMVREGEMASAAVALKDDGRSLSLELPDGLAFDEWVAIGRRLCASSQVINWHIGDWWAFGDHRYGERAAAAAEGIFGRDFGTLANLATVARRFESSRRHEVLTFSHHQEVASLPRETADDLLRKAEAERLSTRAAPRSTRA